MKTVWIYTDGACRGNPGPGGYGALLRFQRSDGAWVEKEMLGGVAETTNNRMELTAAIEALTYLKKPCQVILATDSVYVQQGITVWIKQWQSNGWRTRSGPVRNQDLWQALLGLVNRHDVRWVWVKGHAGHVENERADALAKQGMKNQSDRVLE